jgi:hypothetical protein
MMDIKKIWKPFSKMESANGYVMINKDDYVRARDCVNSMSGIYNPYAAISELERLRTENVRLQSVIDEANTQEPVASRRKDFMGNYVYRNEIISGNEPLFSRQLTAQQSAYFLTQYIAPAESVDPKNFGAIPDAQQSPVVAVPAEQIILDWLGRAKIEGKKNLYALKLCEIKQMLSEISRSSPSTSITEQDATEIEGPEVYLFRRKGLEPFLTCSRERFDEISRNDSFETKVLYKNALFSAPFPHSRISEQDAREIAMSAWRYWMNGCGRTIDTWVEEEWPNVLNKLNGDKNGE